jgi:hypothetical protein
MKNMIKQLSLKTKRLWIYGVLFIHPTKRGWMLAKAPGQTIADSKEEAIKYAANNTIGKLRGIVSNENIIFCVDMTDIAIANNFSAVNDYAKFDDYIRPHFPNWNGIITNEFGGSSNELLQFDASNLTKIDIELQLLNAVENVSKQNLINPTQIYQTRSWYKPLLHNIKTQRLVQSCLAGCTGSGKEVATLEMIMTEHDLGMNDGRYNKNTFHIHMATIPSTALEPINELSKVKGTENSDFTRFRIYVLDRFAKSYFKELTDSVPMWAAQNVTIIKGTHEIPKIIGNEIPLLIGSYVDLGLKGKETFLLQKSYRNLYKRVGIFSIGEAHKFLSNANNKLWNNVKKLGKFLLCVTATPYDFIFNESGHIYFNSNELALFTKTDLYNLKKLGNPEYQKFPDQLFYALNGLQFAIESLKKNPKWKKDANGMTYKKLFTIQNKKFKYEHAILHMFKRLFNRDINPFTGQIDGISILNAKRLSDVAKRHIIFALPTGDKNNSVNDYIPMLSKLLQSENIISDYKIMEVYDENSLKDIKNTINEDKIKTITLTCNKYLTGTNIPKWGSVVLLREIGDSIKLLEQIFGRVGRASDGKENCGIFIADLNATIDLIVSGQYHVEALRGNVKTPKEIIKEVLDCYYLIDNVDGEWKEIDAPNFMEVLEDLYLKNGHRAAASCIKDLNVPSDFDLQFSEVVIKSCIELTDNGNKGAKNSQSKLVSKQLLLEFEKEYNKATDKEVYFKRMVQRHLVKIRKMCYIYEIDNLKDAISHIEDAISNGNLDIINLIGKGVHYIPTYMKDNLQIDAYTTNIFINQIQKEGIKFETIIDILTDVNDKDENYVPASQKLIDKMIKNLKIKNDETLIDPMAGRGLTIFSAIKSGKVKPENCYYNDKDKSQYLLFKRLNIQFGFGIPESNIFNTDVFCIKKKYDNVISIVPIGQIGDLKYQNYLKSNVLNKNGNLVTIIPTQFLFSKKNAQKTNEVKKLINTIETNKVQLETFLPEEYLPVKKEQPLSLLLLKNSVSDKIKITYNHTEITNSYEVKFVDELNIHGNIQANEIRKINERKCQKENLETISDRCYNPKTKKANNGIKYNWWVRLAKGRGKGGLTPLRSRDLDKNYIIKNEEISKLKKMTGVGIISKEIDKDPFLFGFKTKTECNQFIEFLGTTTFKFLVSLYKIGFNFDRGEFNNIPLMIGFNDKDMMDYFEYSEKNRIFIYNYIKAN